MKLNIERIDIEATAEELKASNTLADGLTNILRNAFNPFRSTAYAWDEKIGEEEEECDD